MNSRIRLRHYFTHYGSLGGVQSIIRSHLNLDPKKNLGSSLLAFFDEQNKESEGSPIDGLGLTGRHSIRHARRIFSQHEDSSNFDVPIYHDLWGLAFLGEFDGSPLRRIGAVHSHWPHLDHQLQRLRGSLDGVFCDSQAIADYVLAQLPELSPKRVVHLPVPTQIAPQAYVKPRNPMSNRRIVIGFVGRLDYAQKRVDRFPPLLSALQNQGINCELQFLGTGDASQSLPKRFPKDSPVSFLGRRSGDEYWKTMSEWDFVLYTSDHEGSPLAMIEAMSAGSIPIFPRIGSGGDLIVRQIEPSLLYSPEDWKSVVAIIRDWSTRDSNTIQESREKCRRLALSHSPEKYHEKFMTFLNRIVSEPRISRDFLSPRPFFFTDALPFALLKRWTPKAFFNANSVAPKTSTR